MDPAQIGSLIDHSLLRPEATTGDVSAACAVALDFGCATICVSPSNVLQAVSEVCGEVVVCSVVGFPSGAHETESKSQEASLAIAHGAGEIDMVLNLRSAVEHEWEDVSAEIRQVVDASAGVPIKAILETALHDSETIRTLSRIAIEAGASFVKTSTGFHPAGGATLEAVSIMRSAVGDGAGVKASGGIRDLKTALEMIEAGASRIGTSSTAGICGEAYGHFVRPNA